MTFTLLLADSLEPGAPARSVVLQPEVLQTSPGGDDVTVTFRPNRSDDLYVSAKSAARLAYRILFREGMVRSPLVVRLRLGEEAPPNVIGRSADLLFALAILLRVYEESGSGVAQTAPVPSVAATGVLDTDGTVRAVEHVASKLAAACAAFSAVPAIIFFPAENAGEVDLAALSRRHPNVSLRAVTHLDQALEDLGIVLERVYLRNPFRGLEHFDYQHRAIFFGRDAEVREVVEQLLRREANGFPGVLVEGASGSGKSSFMRAGLLPALVNPALQGTSLAESLRAQPIRESVRKAVWRVGPLSNAADEARVTQSILECWRALPEFAGNLPQTCASLEDLAKERRRQWPAMQRFVWFIDQFEELFALGFPQSIIDAVGQFLIRLQFEGVWTLACIRADALPQLKQQPAMRQVFGSNEGQYYLETMTHGALDDVISRPAEAAGLSFGLGPSEQRLDQVLREELYAARENMLPLLQFTLHELYQRRRGSELPFEAYQQLGGLSGSVATAAENALLALDKPSSREGESGSLIEVAETRASAAAPDVDVVFRRVMRDLTSVSEDGSASRHYALLDMFPAGSPERAFIDRMVNARLVVTDRQGSQPVVYLAHEALLRSWPRVVTWLQQESTLLRIRDELLRDAHAWETHGRSDGWLGTAPDKLATLGQLDRAAMVPAGVAAEYAERSRRRARRNHLIKNTAIASICALGVLFIIAGLLAIHQRDRALAEAMTSDRTSRFMVSLFKLADPGENRGNSVTVREVLDRGAREIGHGLEREPRIRADLLTAMGEAYTGLGLYDAAKKHLTEARADQTSAAVPAESRVRTLVALGSTLYFAGDYDEAGSVLEQAVTTARRQLSPESILRSEALDDLADVLSQQEKYPEAERLCLEALDADRKRGTEDNATLARTLNSLGSIYYFEGDWAAAEKVMREELVLDEKTSGMKDATTARAMNNLAAVLYLTGRYDENIAILEKALPIYQDVYGSEHPEVEAILNNMGRSMLMAGHIREAVPFLRQAVAMSERLKGPTHDDLVPPLNSLAMIDAFTGDTAKAQAEITRAEQIARLPDHGTLLDQVLLNRADLELRDGSTDKAITSLEESRRLLEAAFPLAKRPSEAWRYAVWDTVNAELLARRGDPAAARRTIESAIPIIAHRFGKSGFYSLIAQQRAHFVEAEGARELRKL